MAIMARQCMAEVVKKWLEMTGTAGMCIEIARNC